MKISDSVHLVGSGGLGVSISHPNDCNVYAVGCGEDEWILIDSGVGRKCERILDQLERDGVPIEKIRHLFLTHGHLDHSGGAHFLRKHLEVRVYASSLCSRALETGDEAAISLTEAKSAGIYPDDFRLCPCKTDRILEDGEAVSIGATEVEAFHTPGHSKDHMSYLFRLERGQKALFAGDTVFSGGKILLSATYDCDLQDYIRTVKKLQRLSFEQLFPGHGLWACEGGKDAIISAASRLDLLSVPENLI